METAKVDVRRLQVLNDRINQMLEVLQQMRLSMHSLQHVPDERAMFGGVTPFPGYGYGYGQTQSFGQPHPFVQSQYPYSTPIPQWGAPIYARPNWTGYEGDVTARFGDARFIDPRLTQQIPFGHNGQFVQNGQLPFPTNGQVPFSHSPTAAFG
jgi:hypothetical protein